MPEQSGIFAAWLRHSVIFRIGAKEMAPRQASLLLWLPLIVLCTGAGVWWQAEGSRWKPPGPPLEESLAGIVLRQAWTHRVPHARCVFLDPAASLVAIAGPEGQVRVLDASGRQLSEQTIRAVDTVTASGPGNLVVAYQREAPADTTLTFLRPDGTVVWERDVGAPIVDAAVAANGRRAACVTADGGIYRFSLEGSPRYRRWRSTGTPRQVYVTPSGSLILVATADPPGVWAYTPEGRFVWKAPTAATSGVARIYPGPEGRFLACATEPQADAGAEPYLSRFVVVSERGRQQWGARLRASLPQVALSGDGRFAAVTYTKWEVLHGRTAHERKVALFETGPTAAGGPQQLWLHGGPFYDPRLVSLAADGTFVATRDGGRALYFFGLTGQLLWRHKMPAPIVATQAAADGRTLLVYCGDGSLSLLTVEGSGE